MPSSGRCSKDNRMAMYDDRQTHVDGLMRILLTVENQPAASHRGALQES